MKFVLIYLVLLCYVASSAVARYYGPYEDTYHDYNDGYMNEYTTSTTETTEVTESADYLRMESELNGLFVAARERIRNKANTDASTAEIISELIHTNATGLLHEYTAFCPPFSHAHGIYMISVADLPPFPVFCDTQIAGPGWTVIQRRINGNINFYRNWTTYQHGFGNISDEFFIGLDKLHAITATTEHELYILLEDFEGNQQHARYDNFLVLSEAEAYKLSSLGKYSGNAGDSLADHLNAKFSTYDMDNDDVMSVCAERYMGAWWYSSDIVCGYSSLNGLYLNGELSDGHLRMGIYWHTWRGSKYSYKSTQMMIRPKCRDSYGNY